MLFVNGKTDVSDTTLATTTYEKGLCNELTRHDCEAWKIVVYDTRRYETSDKDQSEHDVFPIHDLRNTAMDAVETCPHETTTTTTKQGSQPAHSSHT
jgi:ferredoxin